MKRVLLLEDELLIAMSVEDELTTAGFEVATMTNCQDAHAWLDDNVPDVVVVDIKLRDGFASSIITRLLDNKQPFMVHSGDLRSMHEGTPYADAVWLNKPSISGELTAAVNALLTKKSA